MVEHKVEITYRTIAVRGDHHAGSVQLPKVGSRWRVTSTRTLAFRVIFFLFFLAHKWNTEKI